ncbi:hypothetical protein H0H92_011230 [Tricholoma furcatifolium]|nr:hypothetical protein H0H92_011230 [Tricholoma furcatifolium]
MSKLRPPTNSGILSLTAQDERCRTDKRMCPPSKGAMLHAPTTTTRTPPATSNDNTTPTASLKLKPTPSLSLAFSTPRAGAGAGPDLSGSRVAHTFGTEDATFMEASLDLNNLRMTLLDAVPLSDGNVANKLLSVVHDDCTSSTSTCAVLLESHWIFGCELGACSVPHSRRCRPYITSVADLNPDEEHILEAEQEDGVLLTKEVVLEGKVMATAGRPKKWMLGSDADDVEAEDDVDVDVEIEIDTGTSTPSAPRPLQYQRLPPPPPTNPAPGLFTNISPTSHLPRPSSNANVASSTAPGKVTAATNGRTRSTSADLMYSHDLWIWQANRDQ